jgi:hypothetical protein
MSFNKTNPPDKSINVQPHQKYFVYILKCADGSFYAGSATDIEDRLKRHNSGNGAVFTAMRRPVKLVYWEYNLPVPISSGHWFLVTGYWMFDTRYWMLDKYGASHHG